MTTPQRTLIADYLVKDRDDRPLLVVEMKPAEPSRMEGIPLPWPDEVPLPPRARAVAPGPLEQLRSYASAAGTPYAMSVDPDEIRLYTVDGDRLIGPTIRLPTFETLSPYDPELAREDAVGLQMGALLRGWLLDLLYGWKRNGPTGASGLDRTGLRPRMEGGLLESEVRIAGPALR
jgi:hypothetical protein